MVMIPKLPDGQYPFMDQEYPLDQMIMVEAAPELERLLKDEAAKNGTSIIRDQPVEIICRSDDFGDMRFFVWYPRGQDRIHLLVPRDKVSGKA